ncbi:MAG: VanW family protein, partial [Lachnospiraceae bacterium]|nr:VanW family protein [Lachnospiraceae bacterium]
PAALTSLTFDADYYYNTYPDLQAALGYDYNSLYQHYLTSGLAEGRSGSAEFNCLVYRNNYPDLQAAFGNDYRAYCVHYETYGKAEGRSASGDGMALAPAGAKDNTAASAEAPENTLLGSYATAYNPNISRAVNIALAASRINGVVIQPGDSFSFNHTILPRTAANGYVEANVIVNKKYVPGTGGGICQVSSTLYAAMLTAGLPATERHPHSLNVGYIPEGMDATISGNALDLRFTNIFDDPIQIQASADQGTLTISIYKL